MLWEHVEEFGKARDDQARLQAARALVLELQGSPLVVAFKSGERIGRGSVSVAVHGQKVGLLKEFELRMDAEGSLPSIRAVLPEIVEPGDSEEEHEVRRVMEERHETAMSADGYAEVLKSVGVRVERWRPW